MSGRKESDNIPPGIGSNTGKYSGELTFSRENIYLTTEEMHM